MKVTKILNALFVFTLALFATTGIAAADERPDIDREDGVVTITGTSGDDNCKIFVDEDEIEIYVFYFDQDDYRWKSRSRDYRIDRVDEIVFFGLEGNDKITNITAVPLVAYGGPGDDYLHGGDDDDLFGGPGKDCLYGGDGNDLLQPGEQVEDESCVLGGKGNDIFRIPFNYASNNGLFYYRNVSNVDGDDFNPNEDVEQLFFAYNFLISIRP